MTDHHTREGEPLQVPIKKAAEMLGFSRQTLYKMREDGEIFFGCMRGRAMVPVKEIYRLRPGDEKEIRRQLMVPRDKPKKPKPVVYFMDCGPYTKIGFTRNKPSVRLGSIEGANPFTVSLWATIPGSLELERQMHERFAKWAHRREWFKFTSDARGEVVALVREMNGRIHRTGPVMGGF